MSQSMAENMRQSEQIRLDLIRTELDMAFTFAHIARQSHDNAVKRERNAHNARVAYDTATRWAAQSALDDAEIAEFGNRVSTLRLMLIDLGEQDL